MKSGGQLEELGTEYTYEGYGVRENGQWVKARLKRGPKQTN